MSESKQTVFAKCEIPANRELDALIYKAQKEILSAFLRGADYVTLMRNDEAIGVIEKDGHYTPLVTNDWWLPR